MRSLVGDYAPGLRGDGGKA